MQHEQVFSPDGQILGVASEPASIGLWDVKTWQCLQTLQGHTGHPWSIAFSPNGHTKPVVDVLYTATGDRIISCSHDQTIKLWDIHTGECLNTLEGHTSWIWELALHPNNQLVNLLQIQSQYMPAT